MAELQFDHIGGHPLIDLVNTEIMSSGERVDQLASSADVIAWVIDVGLTKEETIQFNWRDDTTVLVQVRAFRQIMREMLEEIVAEELIAETTVEAINQQLPYWQAQPRLIRHNDEFERQLEFVLTQPEHLLAILADSAANFLTTVNLSQVKRCDNGECIRYFLDTSKNHSRRWCSMEGCGNRMKARAHYARGK
jgi:predicted RNA-binding Zn ribbon-like protein